MPAFRKRVWIADFVRAMRRKFPTLAAGDAEQAAESAHGSAFLLTPADAAELYGRERQLPNSKGAERPHDACLDVLAAPTGCGSQKVKSSMVNRQVFFEHGSMLLPSGKYVGTVTFHDVKSGIPITYPEQFDDADDAVAHAFREAIRQRGLPSSFESL